MIKCAHGALNAVQVDFLCIPCHFVVPILQHLLVIKLLVSSILQKFWGAFFEPSVSAVKYFIRNRMRPLRAILSSYDKALEVGDDLLQVSAQRTCAVCAAAVEARD